MSLLVCPRCETRFCPSSGRLTCPSCMRMLETLAGPSAPGQDGGSKSEVGASQPRAEGAAASAASPPSVRCTTCGSVLRADGMCPVPACAGVLGPKATLTGTVSIWPSPARSFVCVPAGDTDVPAEPIPPIDPRKEADIRLMDAEGLATDGSERRPLLREVDRLRALLVSRWCAVCGRTLVCPSHPHP